MTTPIRIYPATEPAGSKPTGSAPAPATPQRPGLVWLHGGGFAGGDLDMPEADHVARTLAAAGITVASVDYRLAVDGIHFPVPLDDVLAAWAQVWAQRAQLGIDRLAIGGASAGANLAAAAALQLADAATAPDLVVLAYPTLLAVQPAPGAALRAALDADPTADRFGPAVVRGMYENYLGTPAEEAPVAAAPALATAADLHAYPRTLIVDAEVDELSVSAEVFAQTLRDAGRDIGLVVQAGTDHGFLNRPERPGAADALALIAERLNGLTT